MANRTIKRLTLLGIGLAVVVVVLGAFTRLVDAGLGCPDWPGCYGHLTWPTNAEEISVAEAIFPDTPVDLDKTWPEMVHRYFAGSLLLLVLGITVLCWRRQPPNQLKEISSVLLVLIICQAAFGAWTVTLKLWPQVVTAHLLGGFATLSMLWVMYLRQGGATALQLTSAAYGRHKRLAQLALAVVIPPEIGYDNATKVAKTAHKNRTTLKEEAVRLGFVDEATFDRVVQPKNMIGPS